MRIYIYLRILCIHAYTHMCTCVYVVSDPPVIAKLLVNDDDVDDGGSDDDDFDVGGRVLVECVCHFFLTLSLCLSPRIIVLDETVSS